MKRWFYFAILSVFLFQTNSAATVDSQLKEKLFQISQNSQKINNEQKPVGLAKEWVGSRVSDVSVPFIENKGQFDSSIKYYSRIFSGSVFVTHSGEIIYSLHGKNNEIESKTSSNPIVLRESFVNSSSAEMKGIDRTDTLISHFSGSDPSKWKSNLPNYRSLGINELYAGINLQLMAYGDNIEKIFVVEPGADYNDIRIRLNNTQKLYVNGDGELEVNTEEGKASFTKPLAYQYITDDNGQRKEFIKVAYWADGDEYGFSVHDYDRTKNLFIDPLVASTYLGSRFYDRGYAIEIDQNGFVYVTGSAGFPDFPSTLGAYKETIENYDMYVSKFDPDLSELLASTFVGGGCRSQGNDLKIDSNGDIIITGNTCAGTFPVTIGAYDTVINGYSQNGFVLKFSNDLTQLKAATLLKGSGRDYCHALALDEMDNVYVVGSSDSADFPVSAGAYRTNNNGDETLFVSKLSNDLSSLLGSTFVGMAEYGNNRDIAVDLTGNIYVAGYTKSALFPTTPGALMTSHPGNTSAFVSKLSSDLTSLSASTFLGGSSHDYGRSLAVNNLGNSYITGYTSSSDFPTTEGVVAQFRPASLSTFITKLNSDLSALDASSFFWGKAYALALDSNSNVYITGVAGADFPVTSGNIGELNGESDVFLSRFDANLSELKTSTIFGRSRSDTGWALAVNSSDDTAYITGYSYSDDLSDMDVLVAKFSYEKEVSWKPLSDSGQSRCFDSGEEISCPGEGEEFWGQDGNYQQRTFSFIDNSNGTVTDKNSGLLWMQNTADTNNNGIIDFEDQLKGEQAGDYCSSLVLGEFDDWRLPTLFELLSIVDFGRVSPAIDPVFTSLSSGYWSSTPYAYSPINMWLVNFNYGMKFHHCMTYDPIDTYIRCVR